MSHIIPRVRRGAEKCQKSLKNKYINWEYSKKIRNKLVEINSLPQNLIAVLSKTSLGFACNWFNNSIKVICFLRKP